MEARETKSWLDAYECLENTSESMLSFLKKSPDKRVRYMIAYSFMEYLYGSLSKHQKDKSEITMFSFATGHGVMEYLFATYLKLVRGMVRVCVIYQEQPLAKHHLGTWEVADAAMGVKMIDDAVDCRQLYDNMKNLNTDILDVQLRAMKNKPFNIRLKQHIDDVKKSIPCVDIFLTAHPQDLLPSLYGRPDVGYDGMRFFVQTSLKLHPESAEHPMFVLWWMGFDHDLIQQVVVHNYGCTRRDETADPEEEIKNDHDNGSKQQGEPGCPKQIQDAFGRQISEKGTVRFMGQGFVENQAKWLALRGLEPIMKWDPPY